MYQVLRKTTQQRSAIVSSGPGRQKECVSKGVAKDSGTKADWGDFGADEMFRLHQQRWTTGAAPTAAADRTLWRGEVPQHVLSTRTSALSA